MTREFLSVTNPKHTPEIAHEPLEGRRLLSGGASNLFGRTATADLNADGRTAPTC